MANFLDTSGLICPEPLMLLHSKMSEMAPLESIEIKATDPATQRDIPKFCQFLGHKLLSHECQENCFIYVVQKHAQLAQKNS